MKKAITLLCGLACFACVILAGGSAVDGSCNLLWTLGWMGGALLCGAAYASLTDREGRHNV